MDSKREKIIAKVLERMTLIKVADGYETDFGLNVHDWEVNFNKQDFPALSVCDLFEENELLNRQPTASRQMNALPIQIRLFAETVAELRKGITDVNKAIKIDSRWAFLEEPLALHTLPKGSGIIVSEDTFEIAGAAVNIEIVYMTNVFDSYQ